MISYKRGLSFRQIISREGKTTLFNYLPSGKIGISSAVRLGLHEILSFLALKKNDSVLVPPICPQGIILPLDRRKVQKDFYHLKGNFLIDLNDLKKRIHERKHKAIFFIHYFGIYNPQIVEVRELCNQYEIILFEDCVHGLFSENEVGKMIGTIGDISFYSLPKMLPVPDGAVFCFNNPIFCFQQVNKSSILLNVSREAHLITLLLNKALANTNNKLISIFLKKTAMLFYGLYYYSLCTLKQNYNISNLSMKIISNIDINRFIHQKQSLFNAYNKKLGYPYEFKITPVAIGFPIIGINNPSTFKSMRKALLKKNVETQALSYAWNYIPITKDYEYERQLIQNHLLLPLDDKITEEEQSMIIEMVLQLIKQK